MVSAGLVVPLLPSYAHSRMILIKILSSRGPIDKLTIVDLIGIYIPYYRMCIREKDTDGLRSRAPDNRACLWIKRVDTQSQGEQISIIVFQITHVG
jgi:hypothetical protein